MGQSTEELTSQIEGTRQRMASDLDTLQDRVSPAAIVERRKQAAYGRVAAVKDKVMGSADTARHRVAEAASSAGDAGGGVASSAQERYDGAPLAAGLAAFGAGMVLAAMLPASRLEAEAAHRVIETAKEQGQPLLDEARSAGEDVLDNVRQSAASSAEQVKDSAQASAQTVAGETRSSAEAVREQAQG
jgi:gas vesicle protein